MSDTGQYFWVVLCKNQRFHKRQNLFFSHKIPLGETDPFVAAPAIGGSVMVRCNDCGREYNYGPDDLVRIELAYSDIGDFTPHPLFG